MHLYIIYMIKSLFFVSLVSIVMPVVGNYWNVVYSFLDMFWLHGDEFSYKPKIDTPLYLPRG